MSDSQKTINSESLRDTILKWLQPRLDEKNYQWIQSQTNHLEKGGEDWEFYTAFSAVPRHLGKNKLKFSDNELQLAKNIREGWKPAEWSIDELGRTLLVLSIAKLEKNDFLDRLEKTFISSDMGEAIALYQSLAILPYPETLRKRAAEGIRSNMTSVFNAVALHNPYPADYFDEGAWNQLVLKALFVESPLYKIQGIDRRRNEKLAKMLVDYAHERWAAGRSVTPELWRPVGPYVDAEIIDNLKTVLANPGDIQKQAAMLALSASPSDRAQIIIADHKPLQKKINYEQITWNTIGQKFNELKVSNKK